MARFLAAGGAYLVVALLGLQLIAEPEGIAMLWPAAGVAAGLVAAAWPRVGPTLAGIACAALVANLLSGRPPEVALVFALANVASAVVFGLVFARCGGQRTFGRHVVAAAAAAAVTSAGVAALVGGSVLHALGASGGNWQTAVGVWLAADLLGIFTAAPLLLVWRGTHPPLTVRQWLEAVSWLAAIATCTALVAGTALPVDSWQRLASLALVFALGHLMATRLPLRLAAAVPTVAAVVAVLALPTGAGVEDSRVPALQLCLALLAASVLAVALLTDRLRRIARLHETAAAEARAAGARAAAHARSLAASEATLGAILDALPVGVVIADPDGGVLRDNAAHRDLWGVPPATTHWRQYDRWVGWRPDTGKRLAAEDWAMTRALRHGEVVRGELVECERFDGGRRVFLNNAAPVHDAGGRIVAGVVVEVDVTERRATERRLLEEAERVQLALDAGAIVGTWNWWLTTGRFTGDERFARSFGLDAERCRAGLGVEDVLDSIHPEDRPRVEQAIAEALARGGPYRCEYRVRQHDGVYRWIEANGRVDLGPDGAPVRFPGVLLDGEERRAAEERLRVALDATRAGVFDWNVADGEIHWTDGHYRVLGLEPGSVAPSYELWSRHLHPDDRERVEQLLAASIADGGHYFAQYRVRGGDGADRWVEAQGVPLGAGPRGASRLIGTIVDVTQRKRYEEALRLADRRKDEFLATLAHELRNPLAPLRTSLVLLERSDDPAVQRQARAMMGRQLAHLVRLVDDLLEVSRVTTGKLKLARERVELAQVVAQAVETSRSRFEARRHRLVVELPDAPVELDGDPVRLAQVFTNLLNNAAKYSDEGGTVVVTATRPGDGRVRLTVRDTGIGIAPDALHRVFELFAQVDAGTHRADGGLGIGLSLAKRLVELHGGTIAADSPGPGCGATFTVELPVASPDGPSARPGARGDGDTAASADPLAADLHHCRIVIADGDADAAAGLAAFLRLGGHDVTVARDGEGALAAVLVEEPQLAIVDLSMPGRDPFEVAQAVRRAPQGRHTVLVALSRRGPVSDRRRALAAGFDHCWVKPVDPPALEALLREMPCAPERSAQPPGRGLARAVHRTPA